MILSIYYYKSINKFSLGLLRQETEAIYNYKDACCRYFF